MAPRRTRSVGELLIDVQLALHLNQKELAELLGCSRRTIIRYYQRGGTILPREWETLARAVHASDRKLAAELAAAGGQTLLGLGLESPPPLPAPATAPVAPAPAPPPPVAAPRREPSSRHLADSIVCAAAEAMQSTPQATRPALVAAFERAIALQMSAEEVLAALIASDPAAEAPLANAR